jgi:hypothetical protein
MISLGDLLVFMGAVSITVIYVTVLHHFISRSEKGDDSQNHSHPEQHVPDNKRHE